MKLYVATDGSDSSSGETRSAPLATLHHAHARAREMAAESTDVEILLLPGTYFLERPLVIEGRGGGKGEGRISFQSLVLDQPATISGGVLVSEWTMFDASKNIWTATVFGPAATRLYVNDRPAVLAGSTPVDSDYSRTPEGYGVSDHVANAWNNPKDMSFVYTGIYPWAEAVIGVNAVEEGRVQMRKPAFDWAQKLYKSTMPDTAEWEGVDKSRGLDLPTRVINDLSFLSEPGSFVYDASETDATTLFYIPRDDEELTASKIIVPVLETLVEGQGTDDAQVANLSFRDLRFAHATWRRPQIDGGYIHYHGVSYFEGGRVQSFEWAQGARVTIPIQYQLAPSCITFTNARHVEFVGCEFTCIDSSAVAFSVGCSDNTITGNTFDYIAGAGISIGTASATHKPGQRNTARNVISRNSLTRVGDGYSGSPAILVVKTQDTLIEHNDISHTPHAGIVSYGGGNTRRLRVRNNLIAHTLEKLADGGGIYLASGQGVSEETGAVVEGNVVTDTVTPYNFAIYADYGGAWTTIRDNIICRADNPVAIATAPPLNNVTIEGNFWDKAPHASDAVPSGVELRGNEQFSADDFDSQVEINERARAIRDGAGRSA